MVFRPDKIISGGQTGADIGGLAGAKKAGIATGGTAPRGYLTETGPQHALLEGFGLVMHASANYRVRTLENVRHSDATLIFATLPNSDGTMLTIRCCEREAKPSLLVQDFGEEAMDAARKFLQVHRPRVLNIAGNRESVAPGLANRVADFMERLFN